MKCTIRHEENLRQQNVRPVHPFLFCFFLLLLPSVYSPLSVFVFVCGAAVLVSRRCVRFPPPFFVLPLATDPMITVIRTVFKIINTTPGRIPQHEDENTDCNRGQVHFSHSERVALSGLHSLSFVLFFFVFGLTTGDSSGRATQARGLLDVKLDSLRCSPSVSTSSLQYRTK